MCSLLIRRVRVRYYVSFKPLLYCSSVRCMSFERDLIWRVMQASWWNLVIRLKWHSIVTQVYIKMKAASFPSRWWWSFVTVWKRAAPCVPPVFRRRCLELTHLRSQPFFSFPDCTTMMFSDSILHSRDPIVVTKSAISQKIHACQRTQNGIWVNCFYSRLLKEHILPW